MTPSIRKFLLFNLLLTVTLSTSLTAIGNLFLDHKDIERQLDSQLIQSALAIQAFIEVKHTKNYISELKKQVKSIHTSARNFFNEAGIGSYNKWLKTSVQFQLLSPEKKILISTPELPDTPILINKTGLSKQVLANHPWRVFALTVSKNHYQIIVAQRYDTWGKLEQKITQDDIYIALLTYPLLGLLIWIIVGKGLNPLRRIASEVSHRAPTYLEPVDIKSVPLEIKPLIDELNRLFSRLQEAFDREKRFAGDAAHELKTPLAALKTQAEVALRTNSPLERKLALEHVIAGVNRSTHIVQQLLTLSRLVPEASLDNIEPLHLPSIIKETVAQLVPNALEKNIEIEFVCNTKHPFIDGSATALNILARNLIDNAIRYTPENGTVKVKVERTPEHVILTVTDNGPGIPEELRDRVFERFFRILGNKSPGSGLGLSIVQQISGLHGARLKLSSGENNQGLSVEVAFPTT